MAGQPVHRYLSARTRTGVDQQLSSPRASSSGHRRSRVEPAGELELRRRVRRERPKLEGAPQSTYAKWIKGQLDREGACLELPFTITLLLSFSLLSMAYVGQEAVMIVEQAIVTDISENANFAWAYNYGHKKIKDVNSFADFWSWSRLGLIPLVVPKVPYGQSEDLASAVPARPDAPAYSVDALPTRRPFAGHRLPAPVRNDYLRYNRIIGGLRFSQRVAPATNDLCKFPGQASILEAFIGKSCTPRTDYELPPDLYAAATMEEGEREEWFMSETESYETLIQHLIDMEDGCTSAYEQKRTCLCKWCGDANANYPWLNELTTRVEIVFVVFNAQYGIYATVNVNLWFNRAGHIHKRIHIRTSWSGFSVRDAGVLVVFLAAGAVWLFSNFYVFRTESLELIDQIRKKKKPWYLTLIEDYINFWILVDWVSIVIATVVVGSFLHLNLSISDTNRVFAELATAAEPSSETEYTESVRKFYGVVKEMCRTEQSFRFWLCIYPLVLMMRLFKSFAAQPRLAVVTETFKNAGNDMLHFFIVFTSVYFCMSVNAVLFFGQDDIHFSRLDWALFSCYRAMLGDWDWESMRRIGRDKAFIWFFLFMLVMVLILMNILVSILMQSYASVKTAAGNADSLWAQTLEMLRRARETKQGKRVRLNDIQDALLEDANGNEQSMFNSDRILLPIFRVVLDRTEGADLGLRLDPSLGILLVRGVTPGGLAAQWNASNAQLQVRRGDEIVEVNGNRGEHVGELMQALEKEEQLKIRLRRTDKFQEHKQDARQHLQGSGPLAAPGKARHMHKKGPSKGNHLEQAFLMDLVKGVTERQATLSLQRSMAEEEKMYGEPFLPEDLQEDLQRTLERVGNSVVCAGWLAHKFREYDTDMGDEATAAGPAPAPAAAAGPPRRQPTLLGGLSESGLGEARRAAEAGAAELAEDVAAALGEEMRSLERRQKEQQRTMVHAQESLQDLRQLVLKLDRAWDEVGAVTSRLCQTKADHKAPGVPREPPSGGPSGGAATPGSGRAGNASNSATL